jgi:hypothetical protein
MIERVALACAPIIEEAVAGQWPDGTIERVARAAIEAMRDPTFRMLALGEGYSDMIQPEAVGPNTPASRCEELRCSWRIMIDEALRP